MASIHHVWRGGQEQLQREEVQARSGITTGEEGVSKGHIGPPISTFKQRYEADTSPPSFSFLFFFPPCRWRFQITALSWSISKRCPVFYGQGSKSMKLHAPTALLDSASRVLVLPGELMRWFISVVPHGEWNSEPLGGAYEIPCSERKIDSEGWLNFHFTDASGASFAINSHIGAWTTKLEDGRCFILVKEAKWNEPPEIVLGIPFLRSAYGEFE